MRAGAAYVPLDPGAPDERLEFMLDDADVTVVVTTSSLAGNVEGDGRSLVLLDTDRPAIEALPPGPLGVEVGADDLAYVIYTSGSTGIPKGVLIEHGGVSNLAGVVADIFRLDRTSRVLQFASFAFDASVTELLVPLTTGATVVMAAHEVLASGRGLVELLATDRVTVATLPLPCSPCCRMPCSPISGPCARPVRCALRT